MSAGNQPLIRITVDQMKYSIVAAMQEHIAQLDEQMKVAIDEAIKPESLQPLLNEMAQREIHTAIREEISRFFRYGSGRKVIKELVAKELDRQYPSEE